MGPGGLFRRFAGDSTVVNPFTVRNVLRGDGGARIVLFPQLLGSGFVRGILQGCPMRVVVPLRKADLKNAEPKENSETQWPQVWGKDYIPQD